MAGRGPAPKLPEERRDGHQKRRGEWIELPAVNPAKPPAMPTAPKGGWSVGTRSAWKAWWADPVSLCWTPADVENVRALAYLHHEVERGKSSAAPEVRLRLDGLGLTQKGKRDFRWRIVTDEVAGAREKSKPAPHYERLRVVNAVEGTEPSG